MSFLGCSDAQETKDVKVPVQVGDIHSEFDTNLGYHITLTNVELYVKDFEFAVAGEAHMAALSKDASPVRLAVASWMHELSELVIPSAYAHPGHFSNGDVTGELKGDFTLKWLTERDTRLGDAKLLVGDYTSANFAMVTQTSPTTGEKASIVVEGTATKDGESVTFSLGFTAPDGAKILGVPCHGATSAKEGSPKSISVDFVPNKTEYTKSLFDKIDFLELTQPLERTWTQHVQPGPAVSKNVKDAYYLIRRRLLTHDYYQFTFK